MKGKVGNIIVLLTAIVSALLLAEVAVRIFGSQETENLMHNNYFPHSQYGWTFTQNLKKGFSSADFLITINTNERGFRGPLYDHKKRPGTYRILGLGDSTLFGWGVNYDDIVLSQLEEMLQEDPRFRDKKVEGINMGIPAFSTPQYRKILTTEGEKWNPDLVLVFFDSNDWIEEFDFKKKFVDKDGFLISHQQEFSFRSLREFLAPARFFLKKNSQMYMLVRDRFKRLLMEKKLMGVPNVELYRKDKDFSKKHVNTLEAINDMHRYSRDRLNSDFLLFIIPAKMHVRESLHDIVKKAYNLSDDDYDWLQPQSILIDYCRSNNIPYLYPIQVLQEDETTQRRTYFDIDGHWNTLGHRVAAKEISQYLRSETRN